MTSAIKQAPQDFRREIPDAELFTAMVENSFDSLLLCEQDGTIFRVFSQKTSLALNSPGDLVGRSVATIFPQLDKAQLSARWDRLIRGHQRRASLELNYFDKNGIPVHTQLQLFNLLNQPGIKGIVAAISRLDSEINPFPDDESLQRLKQKIFHSAPVILYVLDLKTKLFLEGLRQFAEILEMQVEDIQAQPEGVYSLIHPEDFEQVKSQEEKLANAPDGHVESVEFRLRTGTGDWLWVQVNSSICKRDEAGTPTIEIGSIYNITARKKAEAELDQRERYYRALVEHGYDCIMLYDDEGFIRYASPAATLVTGYSPEEMIGRAGLDFVHEEDREAAAQGLAEVREHPDSIKLIQRRLIHKSGRVVWIESRLTNLLEDPDVNGVVINFRDVTERKLADRRINHLANYDVLTDLPNRRLFMHRLYKGLVKAIKNQDSLALMYIDLDRFKDVNDTLGHHVGDDLLVEVSGALSTCLRESDTLARVGGDEFTIVLPGADRRQAEMVAERILRKFKEPFKAGEHTVDMSASIGISLFPEDSKKAEELFRFSDIAMYEAKSKRNRFSFYFQEDKSRIEQKLTLEKKLRYAIETDVLKVYYQARVDIKTGMIHSLEALCRWYDDDLGDISPAVFIPLAEESGMIHDLGRLMLEKICAQLVKWRAAQIDVPVAINLSIKELQRPDIVTQFRSALHRYGLDGSRLEIEITESTAMTDVEHSVKVLNQFKALGLKLSIDDFGKGYSSLSYLTQFPVDNLKIDQFFIAELTGEAKSRSTNTSIVRAIIGLAGSLGLKTVAEGVESSHQESLLMTMGCQLVQGHFYCRPMAGSAISPILEKGFIRAETNR